MTRMDLLPTTFETKLGKIVEEAGEFMQTYDKFIRHGLIAIDPVTNKIYDNKMDMLNELNDLRFAINRLLDEL